ncbi:hypothetical protein EDB83DRAFT_1508911 [Lactarius deliciosus]|nr:hypothetical protein EDB83DRAFT_1508911 [Lactarius deliciosus]
MRSRDPVLIRDVGVDLFDGHWAQRAADISVALDFVLPVPPVTAASHAVPPPPLKIGHNLYDKRYTFLRLPIPCTSVPLRNGVTRGRRIPHTPIPYARAYVHHLLHTHEMSAHTLLALHNLAVLDTFFAGARRVLSERSRGSSKLTMRSLGCRI